VGFAQLALSGCAGASCAAHTGNAAADAASGTDDNSVAMAATLLCCAVCVA